MHVQIVFLENLVNIKSDLRRWKNIYLFVCLMTLIWLTFHQFYTVPNLYSSYNKPIRLTHVKKLDISEEVRRTPHERRARADTNSSKSGSQSLTVNDNVDSIIKNTTSLALNEYSSAKEQLLQMFSERRITRSVSCKKMFENDKPEIRKAIGYMFLQKKKEISAELYMNATENCQTFRHQRGYFDTSVTLEEKDFPLAFSIVAYKNTEQIERLLRAIYRPQNFYCIHLDKKTDTEVMQAVKSITSCFSNVFVSKTSVSVHWGYFSVLEAELACMNELWEYKGWKYFINLTGQEFPLKTNLELVRILKALKGANVVGGSRNRAKYVNYRRYRHAPRAPHGIKVVKGPVHVIINRDFVDFALHDNRSLDFIEWLKGTRIPDESFFSSLNYNPHLGIPGSFLGDPEEYPEKPLFSRYKNWQWPNADWNRPCSGLYIHHICIPGVGDLHRVVDPLGLFLNKVLVNYQPLTFDCLEELILNRTFDQYLNDSPIDVTRYSNLDQVKFRLIK